MKKYRTLIIVAILVSLVVLYSYYLSEQNKTVKNKKNNEDKEFSKVLNRDLEKNYPATPREVIDYYSQLLSYIYSGDCSKENIEAAGKKCRALFDSELLERNPEEEYFENLKSDIEKYKQEGKTISAYILEKNGNVEYKTFQSHYYASVKCAYYVKGTKSTSRTIETYTLRKDNEGKWKILYWSLTPLEEDE